MTFDQWVLIGLGVVILLVLGIVLRLAWTAHFTPDKPEGDGP